MQGGVKRPSRKAGRGWESPKQGQEKWKALQESWEGSGGPSGEPGGVGKPGEVGSPSQTVGRARQAFPEGHKGSEGMGGVRRP